MCMLTYYPNDVMPDIHALRNGAEFNNDGHGYAIVERGRIIVRKSLDFERLATAFTKDRLAHPDGPALFHSRFATHGRVNKQNCHPFRVGGDKQTILAHNGVMPIQWQPSGKDARTDTAVFAEEYVSRLTKGWLDKDDERDIVELRLKSNKVVVLTTNPAFERRAYILNEQYGEWFNGAWYSNDDYLDEPEFSYRNWVKWDKADWTKWEDAESWADQDVPGSQDPGVSAWLATRQTETMDCDYCLTLASVSPEKGICRWCRTCAWCSHDENDCKCGQHVSDAVARMLAPGKDS